MKIKTEYYGVFYKNRDKWVGPIYDDIFIKPKDGNNTIIDMTLKLYQRRIKKKVKLFRQYWKSSK
jgi:hypothetical protein